MGKAALIAVAAVILAGSFLLLNVQRANRDTNRKQGEQQRDVLARELARTGHSLILTHAVDGKGFRGKPEFETLAHGGGTIVVPDGTYEVNGNVLEFTVEGRYGGTVHRIRSTYRWDGLHFPSPLWMEGPSPSANLASGARIDGGKENHPILFDGAVFEKLGLDELGLSFNGMVRDFMSEVGGTKSRGVREALLDEARRAAFEQDGTPTLGEIYRAIVSYPGADLLQNPQALTGELGSKNAPVILLADRDVLVKDKVKGHGILVIEGGLSVPAGTSFDWEGFVLMNPGEGFAEANLAGKTKINGAMALLQEGVPPGGHMDVTAFRDYTGTWSDPWGSTYWKLKHTHKYNEKEGDTVFFTGNQEAGRPERLKFTETLQSLGSRDVYLEFSNSQQHGLSRLSLDVEGHDPVAGPVARGFGGLASPLSPYRTGTFKADDLNGLEIDVRSLSMLQKMWDAQDGCQSGPHCVSASYNREGALTVSLREAGTDKLVYQASVYWHRRLDEVAEHEQQMEQWRNEIRAGKQIGFRLTMSDHASIAYDEKALDVLAEVLAADALALKHLGTWEQHWGPHDEGNPIEQERKRDKKDKKKRDRDGDDDDDDDDDDEDEDDDDD